MKVGRFGGVRWRQGRINRLPQFRWARVPRGSGGCRRDGHLPTLRCEARLVYLQYIKVGRLGASALRRIRRVPRDFDQIHHLPKPGSIRLLDHDFLTHLSLFLGQENLALLVAVSNGALLQLFHDDLLGKNSHPVGLADALSTPRGSQSLDRNPHVFLENIVLGITRARSNRTDWPVESHVKGGDDAGGRRSRGATCYYSIS